MPFTVGEGDPADGEFPERYSGEISMGVGFHLSATYPNLDGGQSGDDWLAEVAAWVEAHETEPLMVCRQAHCDKGEPALFVHVHPGAEEIEFCVPEPGRLIASATSRNQWAVRGPRGVRMPSCSG